MYTPWNCQLPKEGRPAKNGYQICIFRVQFVPNKYVRVRRIFINALYFKVKSIKGIVQMITSQSTKRVDENHDGRSHSQMAILWYCGI